MRKRYTTAFKVKVVLELLKEEKTVNQLAAVQERERDELFAQIGRLTTQLAWLKKKSGLEPPEK